MELVPVVPGNNYVSTIEGLFLRTFQVGLTTLRYNVIFAVIIVVIITKHTND